MAASIPPTPDRRPARRARTVTRALGVSVGVHAGILAALGAVVAPQLWAPPTLSSATRFEVPVLLEETPEPAPPPPLPSPARPRLVEPEPLPDEPSKPETSFEEPSVPEAPAGLAVEDPFGARTSIQLPRRLATPVEDRATSDAPRPPQAEAAPAPLTRPRAAASNRLPRYPGIARRKGWTGTVVLAVEVAADGSVADVRVVESSGRALLDEAALDAVAAWRYEPARRGDDAVAFTLRQPVTFALD